MIPNFIRRNESIVGVVISTIGGLAFNIYGVNEPLPFWVTGGITLTALLYIWYQNNQNFYRLEDIKEKQKCELNKREKDINTKDQEITSLKKRLDDMEKKLLDYRNLNIDVVDVDIRENRVRFRCNFNSNMIAKNQCITVYKMENGYIDILGLAVIENYNVVDRMGQAKISWLDLEISSEKIEKLKKENTYLYPWIDAEIFFAVVYNRGGYE